MPPKIAQRLSITPEFVDTMIAMYATWMRLNERMIRMAGSNSTSEHMAMTARRMLPIVRRVSPDARSGLDYELTRLRGLPYKEFTVIENADPINQGNQTTWLVGRTKHVTITKWNARKQPLGELGEYFVYIPFSIIKKPNISAIHMIPLRNMHSARRHPHHYVSESEAAGNPLQALTGNCYGSYSGVIKSLLDEPDIPELFRQLYYHLCTEGVSPPVRLSALDFDWQSPE